MDRLLTERIYEKCPIIFRGRKAGIDENLIGFGFSCDDGWFQIIDELSVQNEAIARTLKESSLKHESLPIVVQVKEKFGTLRYYMHHSTDEIEALIHQARVKSTLTCECCGARGSFRTGGYIRLLCDECYSKHKFKQGKS